MTYDLILVGTGFSSTFFLKKYLEKADQSKKILVLEKGLRKDQSWWIKNKNSVFRQAQHSIESNKSNEKTWVFSVHFGGGSNCWWACTPRMLPNDFRMQSKYGVGIDWPVQYDDLEPYYCDAEEAMAVAGNSDDTPFSRSRPYPLAPHRFNHTDLALKRAFPDTYFIMPTARPSAITSTGRPACCGNGVCDACPIDSKYTIRRDHAELYADPRVTLFTEATVQSLMTNNDVISGVHYRHNGKDQTAKADFVGVGANAIFNAQILLNSGIEHPLLGKRLHEQRALNVTVDLDGLNNFQGSTVITGHGYMLYDGEHRRNWAAALIENTNTVTPKLIRTEKGKWRQRMELKFIFEDLPDERNYVSVSHDAKEPPQVNYAGASDYCRKGMENLPQGLDRILAPLPVENVRISRRMSNTESHILGTALMGNDPDTSVVDSNQLHHVYRNLAVLGGSSFPTGAPANPTLTMCALSLRSAQNIFGWP
jgi:choline dehydrogenase-like flavoprotein